MNGVCSCQPIPARLFNSLGCFWCLRGYSPQGDSLFYLIQIRLTIVLMQCVNVWFLNIFGCEISLRFSFEIVTVKILVMDVFVSILILCLIAGLYVYPILCVIRDKKLTPRMRANLTWCVCAFPFVGTAIYFFFKWISSRKGKTICYANWLVCLCFL